MTYCCTRCMFEQIFISLILLFHFGGCILWPFSLSEILSSYSSTNCLDLHYICFSFIVFYHCASLGVRFLQGSIICLVLYFFSYLTKISTYTTNTPSKFFNSCTSYIAVYFRHGFHIEDLSIFMNIFILKTLSWTNFLLYLKTKLCNILDVSHC